MTTIVTLFRPDPVLTGMTQCAQCDQLVHQELAVVKCYFTEHMQHQEHFCSDRCHIEWYLARLNTLGR
jgi:hypothetical protein